MRLAETSLVSTIYPRFHRNRQTPADFPLGQQNIASEHATTQVIEDFTAEIKKTLKVQA